MAKYQKYAEYQDSGVEWLGEIPKDWSILKLKYAVDLISEKDQDGTQKYVGMENIASKNGKYVITEDVIPEGVSNTFKKDDVLFGKLRPYLAKSWLANFSGICSSELLVLRAKQVCPKFLQYYTLTDEFINQVDSSTYGSKMPRASWDFISLLPIPKCSYELSLKIANFLDHETAKIDGLIAKQEKLIELLKEKRQAVISHAVTKGLNPDVAMKDSGVEWLGQVPEHWEMASVRRYLVEHRQGYYTTDSYVDEGLKLLRITDLRDLGQINTSYCPMVNESDTTHLFKLQKGDVVFARTGGAGSFGVITEDYDDLIYASYLIRFRFMNKVFEPDYLRFLFQSDSFQLSVKQNIHGGVNQNIHAEDIKNTVVCAPSLSEQKEIIKYLENQCSLFENLISKAIYSVQLMQERRIALISSAVTGKIDVRNWQNPNHNNNEANKELGT